MKQLIALSLLVVAGCTPGNDHSQHESSDQDSSNVILYNQVMDIHDEVMPKMEDLYNIKKDAEDKLKDPSSLAAGEAEKLERRLAQIDSVSKMMMDWMHAFSPPADTASEEAKRTYLEEELEKVKIVKQAMMETVADSLN